MERKGKRWVTLTTLQAHRKVGHALRDAAARESSRGSKKQDDDDKVNHGSWGNGAWQDQAARQNMAPFNEELSWIDLDWDEISGDDQSLIPQNEVLEVLQEFQVLNWRHRIGRD